MYEDLLTSGGIKEVDITDPRDHTDSSLETQDSQMEGADVGEQLRAVELRATKNVSKEMVELKVQEAKCNITCLYLTPKDRQGYIPTENSNMTRSFMAKRRYDLSCEDLGFNAFFFNKCLGASLEAIFGLCVFLQDWKGNDEAATAADDVKARLNIKNRRDGSFVFFRR